MSDYVGLETIASILSLYDVLWDRLVIREGRVLLSWRGWLYVFRYFRGGIDEVHSYYRKVAHVIRHHQLEVKLGGVPGILGIVNVDKHLAGQEGGSPVQRGQGLHDSR